MKMNDHIEIDFAGIKSEEELHNHIFKILEFPDYYGMNWDAFDECIRDISIPKKIIITHFEELQRNVPRGARLLKECLSDLASEKGKEIEIIIC